jgi:hypothetical protein
MHIYGVGEGTVDLAEIQAEDHRASFLNLFNCSAARFTEPNLAATYLVGTGWGLAVIGPTKVGGLLYPRAFHQALGDGFGWGESFRKWYNQTGASDDAWFLGTVILGDPMLMVPGDLGRAGVEPGPALAGEAEPSDLEALMRRAAGQNRTRGFEAYRAAHPDFF